MLAPPSLPRTLEACFRDLGSKKPEIRAHAAEELGRHLSGGETAAQERGVEALVKALGDTHPAVRARAATALSDARATSALPSLLVAVEDDDGLVRQMALSALGELGDARASSKLRRALGDARPEVRYQALIAFERVASDEATGPLTEALDDDDAAVRHIALRVSEERLEQGKKLDETSSRALADGSARLLDDQSSDVAVAAAILLTKLGDKRGKAKLLAVAQGSLRGKLGIEEEQGAIEACGEAKLTQAIPALERRAFGITRFFRDNSVMHAKVALAAMGHERARAELLADLEASKPHVRDRAIVAVGRARLEAARVSLEKLARNEATRELAQEALARLG